MSALVDAFERDPLARWLFPDSEARLATHRELFAESIGAPAPGTVIDVTDDLNAAAIWLPPGDGPALEAPPSHTSASAQLFGMLRESKPAGEFWYLEFLGARTAGASAGSALMQHRLAEVRRRCLTLDGQRGEPPILRALQIRS